MLVAAIFQIADGIQIGAAAALRAYKDTAFPMAINIFSYWVVAFPLGYLAAITYRLPANQIWVAFIAGLGLGGDIPDLAIQSPVASLTLSEIRAVAGKVLVFLARVLAAQQLVAVREAAELVDDVLMQFSELRHGQEGLLVSR